MHSVMQCHDTNLVLPSANDEEENSFVQKTAIQLRKLELESVNEVFNQLTEANFTMDKELEKLNGNLARDIENGHNGHNGHNSHNGNNSKDIVIPSESLIIYNENETAPLPEIILDMLGSINANKDNWYIYGIKNPESFYKSFMLLTHMDFIIKNKTEKKNEVATFKREMAMHYETFYKTLGYYKLRFAHVDMVHKLTGIDNYCEYDAIRYVADYSKINLIILDVINKKYIDIKHSDHNLKTGTSNDSGNSSIIYDHSKFILIIKYSNETYLPLMNSNGVHQIDKTILEYINRYFERIKLDKFKEVIPDITGTNIVSNNLEIDSDSNESTGCEITLSDIEEDTMNSRPGNILESKTVSVFFNNTPINKKSDVINRDPIIKTGQFTIAVEDMIEINELSNEISNEISNDISNDISNSNSNSNIVNMESITIRDLQEIQHTNITSIITKEKENTKCEYKTKELEPIINAFDELMAKIPNSKTSEKIDKKTTSSNSNTIPKVSSITKKSKVIDTSDIKSTVPKKPVLEELKPLKLYTLIDLQILARLHKIDPQKEGRGEKKINKTKEEIYNEILEYQQSKK